MIDIVKDVPDKRLRKPVFFPLKNSLTKAIDEGTLAPGAPIPSEHEMCRKFGISRQSVRQALKELEEENLIFRRPGKGTFVKDGSLNEDVHKSEVIRTIGIDVDLLAKTEDWYLSKLVRGVQNVCGANHCRLSLMAHTGLEKLKKGFVDGLILTGANPNEYEMYERMTKLEIHPVLINRVTEHENVAYVSVNYRSESEKAAKLLLDKGHRKIGLVSSSLDPNLNQPRYAGFKDSLKKNSLDEIPQLCEVPERQSNEFYANAIYEYLKKADITAIYLLNGCFAVPLFLAVQRLGMKIPDDLEILCFDDIGYISDFYPYPFTYVKMPLLEMGSDASEYLLKKIESGKNYPVLKKMYKAELVIK